MTTRATATICRICKEGCGILVESAGRDTVLRGNPEHPISRGFVCFRGKNFPEVHHSPERLTQPLLRRKHGWEKILWEDALDLISSNLWKSRVKYGPQSVVFFKGESLKHQEVAQYMRHLAYAFGTPNYITVGSLCHQSMTMAFGLTLGGIPAPDFERMKTAIIWGANPAVSFPCTWSSLKPAIREGVRMVVIDPSLSRTAASAHLHLPITPGSDGFLALAFIKYAVQEAGLRPQPSWSVGWNELEALVRGYSYEDLLVRTGIATEGFHEAASTIFRNLPGWVQAGSGLELQPSGVQTIRALALLQSLLDPQDRPGAPPARLRPLPGVDHYPERVAPIGDEAFPIYTRTSRGGGQGMLLPRAILQQDPYPVRAMLVAGSNPLLTFAASNLYGRAFESLDFLAVFDLFLTPTARLAHVVLPAADFLETLELHDYFAAGRSRLGLVRPVVSSSTRWPAWKLLFELARKWDLGDFFPWKENEEALAFRLAGSGVSLEDLLTSPSSTAAYSPARVAKDGWNTPDGRVHYTSEILAAAGLPALPTSDSLGLPLHTDEAYPFWLSTGDRVAFFQHSQFREHPTYRAMMPRPELDLHPDAASKLGISDKDLAVLSTRNGRIDIRVQLTPDVRRDCLRLTHGWPEANANALTGLDHLDPVSGFPWMRAVPANVERKPD